MQTVARLNSDHSAFFGASPIPSEHAQSSVLRKLHVRLPTGKVLSGIIVQDSIICAGRVAIVSGF